MSRAAKILQVLGVLFLAFVCAIASLIWFFDPVRHAHEFDAKVKKNVNPQELRVWAEKLASTPPPSHVTNINQLPASLRDLDPNFESGWIIPKNQKEIWHVGLIYGGGFFHYGIEIGPTNFVDSSDAQLTVIPWVPGIYFKHEGTRQ